MPVTAVGYWLLSKHGRADKLGCQLADRHYSRRKKGSKQFVPPGQCFVLVHNSCLGKAVFAWWRPHPKSGLKLMSGLDGWTCTIFRNETSVLSSILILEAENFLKKNVDDDCGPDGLLTYVWDTKVKSQNKGYCFKKAGWSIKGRSADKKKTLLFKKF